MEKITRKEAIAKGLSNYFSGKPCKRGHTAKRNVNGNCLTCRSEDVKQKVKRGICLGCGGQSRPRRSHCEVCSKKFSSDKKRRNKKAKEARVRLRDEIIDSYGGKCNCCGESERVFLALDHVHGGGSQDRQKHGGQAIYYRVRREGFPTDYQILCFNCNWARHLLGTCPHQAAHTS